MFRDPHWCEIARHAHMLFAMDKGRCVIKLNTVVLCMLLS